MSRIECAHCPEGFSVTVTAPAKADFEFFGLITHFDYSDYPNITRHPFPYRFVVGQTVRGGEIGVKQPPHAPRPWEMKPPGQDRTIAQILEAAGQSGLKQDMKEAVSAKLWGLHKACLGLCRRVIQLALLTRLLAIAETNRESVESALDAAYPNSKGKRTVEDIQDFTLGPLLKVERHCSPPLLTPLQHELATRIKEAGDDALHNEANFEPDFVDTCIIETAQIAASLAMMTPPVAAPPRTGSNAPSA